MDGLEPHEMDIVKQQRLEKLRRRVGDMHDDGAAGEQCAQARGVAESRERQEVAEAACMRRQRACRALVTGEAMV